MDTEKNPAIKRELDAGEDPLDKQQKEQVAKQDDEAPSDYSLYASIRGRYRQIIGDRSVWEDNGSRLGINVWYEIVAKTWLFGRYELGLNLLQELGLDSEYTQPDQNIGHTLFTRLAYVGVQKEENIVVIGKNWSTYYQVAGFTDRFDSSGGEASGAFNGASDGGDSGTGRADQVLQTRLNLDLFKIRKGFKPLAINMQIQRGQPIPGLDNHDYNYGFGASTIVELWNNVSIGIAYNYSAIDLQKIPAAERNGLNGSMSALLLGSQWIAEDWYLAATLSRSTNLQMTNTQQYFEGTGIELYGQYQLFSNIWLLGGYNYLAPDSDQQQTGDYLLSYALFGVRYTIQDFTRMIYLESRLDQGRTTDNHNLGNQIIVGLRWSF